MQSWRKAGIGTGQHVVDFGCGPGFAAIERARMVGETGRVTALDASADFLAHLHGMARRHGLDNIAAVEADLDTHALGQGDADAVWCRWVMSFVRQPQALAERIAAALRPGGVAVFHEYIDYATWRLMPPAAPFDALVGHIESSWRAAHGDPDIAMFLPAWLESSGLDVIHARPMLTVTRPREPMWCWTAAFVDSSFDRLVTLGRLSSQEAEAIDAAWQAAVENPGCRMVTPCVLELIARKPSG